MSPLDRRTFLQLLGTGAAGVTTTGLLPSSLSAARGASPDGPVLQIGEDIAVAPTRQGRVRGFIHRGIHVFRGIPYGADTGGANRFLPPQPPAAWDDVRPAIWWGPSAPQDMTGRYSSSHYAFGDHWNYDELSEDCLRLNVWTPALGDARRRPVLLWLHGGGFINGNGIEQDGYDGENLARTGDVVFCSVNHRLGALGYADLSGAFGEDAAHSGNVGMLDLVAALRWVRDNIAGFGGDPDNVTIIGQSGGGAKVCTLLAMPAAQGLVHRAVALSGTATSGLEQDYARELGRRVVAAAGARTLADLQRMPWAQYLDLANRTARALAEERPAYAGFRGGFRPVGNGLDLPAGEFFADRTGWSSRVPTLLCTTFNEQSPSREDASLEDVTRDDVVARLRDRFGERTPEIVEAYARAFPELKPVEVWSFILSNRVPVVRAANARAQQGAPVYVAWFGWQPPLFDGRLRAFHCIDICFWFANTDLMITHTGGGARPRRLADRMSAALVQFMRTGSPNGTGQLPDWPTYTPADGLTMILNDVPEVKPDPDRTARQVLESA